MRSFKITAIVPSAGKGIRFNSEKRKPLVDLNGRPLLLHALRTLQSSPLINDIVLVVGKDLIKDAERLIKSNKVAKVRHIVEGGRTRSESVRKGLQYVDRDASLVLIHDGVRPFVSKEMLEKTVAAAKRFGASIAAVPVKATIKVSRSGSFVKYTPDRKNLWEIQTPQVFKRDLIENAYKRIKPNSSFTDDAVLIENAGKKVKIVRGDYRNIKITTLEDIKVAKALLKK